MSDGFGNPIFVFNPHTYDELHKMVGKGVIDRYLRCISQMEVGDAYEAEFPGGCQKPSVHTFDDQVRTLVASHTQYRQILNFF